MRAALFLSLALLGACDKEVLVLVHSPAPVGSGRSIQQVVTETDLNNLHQALRLYKLDNRKFPAALQELVPRYLEKVPTDMWERPYLYDLGTTKLYSGGPDGIAGSADDIHYVPRVECSWWEMCRYKEQK